MLFVGKIAHVAFVLANRSAHDLCLAAVCVEIVHQLDDIDCRPADIQARNHVHHFERAICVYGECWLVALHGSDSTRAASFPARTTRQICAPTETNSAQKLVVNLTPALAVRETPSLHWRREGEAAVFKPLSTKWRGGGMRLIRAQSALFIREVFHAILRPSCVVGGSS